MRAYLELLQVEVTAFHPSRRERREDSSLWPYSSPYTSPACAGQAFGGRPLAVTLLYGVRTFLPPSCDGQRLSGLLRPLFYRDATSGTSNNRDFSSGFGKTFLLRYRFF